MIQSRWKSRRGEGKTTIIPILSEELKLFQDILELVVDSDGVLHIRNIPIIVANVKINNDGGIEEIWLEETYFDFRETYPYIDTIDGYEELTWHNSWDSTHSTNFGLWGIFKNWENIKD